SAADLGHYVGDAHQPLHATKDYNGRSGVSGSYGIHSRYESTMIHANLGQLSVHPDSIHFVGNPVDFMFGIIYQSNAYVDSIYDADAYARQSSGWNGSGTTPAAYTSALWQKTGAFTQLQIQRASQNLASLLYTAWVNAGSPNLTDVPFASTSSTIPEVATLGQSFPNPFNPATTIEYRLQHSARIRLTVYSLAGEQVAVLVNGTLPAGAHRARFDASALSLASGIYFYRLEVIESRNRYALTDKMIFVK
ncbi:MAG TPA: T9SS type A sorting domain-containing protein, partial [Bacteroidota bacterium]|nr:T9SS type A sorting domain-containing protein [Bacteroidota bacterium]